MGGKAKRRTEESCTVDSPLLFFFYTIVRSRVCQEEEEGGKRIRERKRLGGSRSGYG